MYKREYPLSDKTAAFNSKLVEKYSGLLKMQRIISLVIVYLRDDQGRWSRHIHIKNLKPAQNDEQHGPTKQ